MLLRLKRPWIDKWIFLLVFWFLLLVRVATATKGDGAYGSVRYLGWPAIWRPKEDMMRRAAFIVNPAQTLQEEGVITGFYAYIKRGRRTQFCYLQVWRPVRRQMFKLIGHMYFRAMWIGLSNFLLRRHDQITVMPGDILGLYFPRYNPIPWSPIPCKSPEHRYYVLPTVHKMRVNQTYHFKWLVSFNQGADDFAKCREYSFNASIMRAEELRYFDASALADGRYRRPYGKYQPTKYPPVSDSCDALVATNYSPFIVTSFLLLCCLYDRPWLCYL